MNGIGPNITSVIIYSFSPLMAQVGLAIPMEPPKPVKVVVDFNLITLFSTNVVSLEPKTPVARFYFDNLVIEPKLPVIYWTHNVTVLDMNLPWISWVLGLFRSLGNIDLELYL